MTQRKQLLACLPFGTEPPDRMFKSRFRRHRLCEGGGNFSEGTSNDCFQENSCMSGIGRIATTKLREPPA